MRIHDPNKRMASRFVLFLPLALVISTACTCSTLSDLAMLQTAHTRTPPAGEAAPSETSAITSHPPDQTTLSDETAEPAPLAWKNNWLHFGVDSQFSSYKPDETQITKQNIAELEFIWGSGCDDGYFSVFGGTPALFHGRIIITHAGGWLESGSPYTGEMFWDFGEPAAAWAPPPVVSSDGVIYYLYVTPDASSKLYAVDAQTGQQIWEAATQFHTGFNFDAQLTVDEKNGLLYIIEDLFGDGRLFAIDRDTGEVQWLLGGERVQAQEMTFAGSIVPLKDDKLYVPADVPAEHSKQSRMVRVDALKQEVDLTYDIPEAAGLGWKVGWYGLCADYVFETYQDSARNATLLAAHHLDQPEVIWQKNIPPQSGRLACDPQQGLVYIPTDKGLLALHASTGEKVWEHAGISSIFSPTIANGILYYLSDTNMYALDQENGSQLFRYPLGVGAHPSTGVAVNDGLVVFSGNGGTCDLVVLGLQ